MDKHELEDWIMGLPIQTLTVELKQEIWNEVYETITNEIINTH